MTLPADRQHWPRWSKIGFLKTIEGVRGSYPVYNEGDERTTRLDTNFCETRLTGPDIFEHFATDYSLVMVLNCLINTKEDANDLYLPDRITGQFTNGFVDVVTIYRWGTGPLDDQSFFGCYYLVSDIEINQYGIVDKTLRVIQTTIEGTYELKLDTT